MSNFNEFQELEVPEHLKRALDAMGFKSPTPIQAGSIPGALKGRDVLGCAQTGTGKTGAFGVPLVDFISREPRKMALVLAPTRELAEQIYKVLKQMCAGSNVGGALVVGGASMHEQIRRLRSGANVIVATPGRLIDHMQQRTVNLSTVEFLVLDEVDRMLDMGFAPQLEQIMPAVTKKRQTMLFSATLPPEVKKLTHAYLNDPMEVTIGSISAPLESIEQEMMHVRQEEKTDVLLKTLEEREGKVLIFARTQSRTERIAKLLTRNGHKVESLHGGRSPGQRRRALDGFRQGKCRMLVATDLAGRGIDVNDVMHVINFDMPATREDYVHRIGRTGRYGKTGNALNFITTEDAWFLNQGKAPGFRRGRKSRGGPGGGGGGGRFRGPRSGNGSGGNGGRFSGRRSERGEGRREDSRSERFGNRRSGEGRPEGGRREGGRPERFGRGDRPRSRY